jgi:MazG family protein
MHAQMGSERGAFTMADIADGICEKMVRRHPHVFGDSQAVDSEAVLRQWEEIKRAEKNGKAPAGILDGISNALPALLRSQTVQKKAARVGFDWPDTEPVFEKIAEETAEVREAIGSGNPAALEVEIGDLLFSVVNLARKLGVDAETALAGSTRRFIARFQSIERRLEADGRRVGDTPLAELDRLWELAKSE